MGRTERVRSVPNALHDHLVELDAGQITTTNFATSVYGGTPTTIDPDDAGAAGTGTTISRSDHQHQATCDTPVATGTALAEGNGTALARNNHVHTIGAGSINSSGMFAAGVVDSAAIATGGVANADLAAGAVTPTKTTVSFARVRRAANQSTTNNVATDISFDTEDEDTGGFWAIGNPTQFVIPAGQAGIVNVTCNLRWAASGTGRRVLIIVYNSLVSVAGSTSNAIGTDPTWHSASTGPMRVSVADTFSFSVLQQSAGALNVIDRTSATIEWLGV